MIWLILGAIGAAFVVWVLWCCLFGYMLSAVMGAAIPPQGQDDNV